MKSRRAILALAVVIPLGPTAAAAASLTMASTTSTENSGLLGAILPRFRAASGIAVRVVAVGTGAALRLGARGDVDVVLVHAPAAEKRFVAAGYGVRRYPVMHNDFVIAGPAADPAGIRRSRGVARALQEIARHGALFVSRGDDSGTHKAERRYWSLAGGAPDGRQRGWYLETGAGMGATLNIAAARGAYVVSDRATWLSFRNKRGLEVLFQGDIRMRNSYGIIPVNPERHPHVRYRAAMKLVEWIVSEDGRRAISAFRIEGRQVFFPDR